MKERTKARIRALEQELADEKAKTKRAKRAFKEIKSLVSCYYFSDETSMGFDRIDGVANRAIDALEAAERNK